MLVNLTIPLSRKLCSCLTIILVWCWHKFCPWIYGITQMGSCRIAYYLRKSSPLNSLILASTETYLSDVDFFWLVLPGPHWVLFLPLLDAATWLEKLDAYALVNWLYTFFAVSPCLEEPGTELGSTELNLSLLRTIFASIARRWVSTRARALELPNFTLIIFFGEWMFRNGY